MKDGGQVFNSMKKSKEANDDCRKRQNKKMWQIVFILKK
jgi:hypothetical protein